jgi:hypothetical protein
MVRVMAVLPFLGSARPLGSDLGSGGDPAGSWLSYARFDADTSSTITAMNSSWIVPELPSKMPLDWCPWYGLQTHKGDGALIQPILDAQFQKDWVIYHAIYDWNTGHYETTKKVPVKPGDKIDASVIYRESDNSYDMYLSANGKAAAGSTGKHNYKLKTQQRATESTAYFVLEGGTGGIKSHCSELPKEGGITFTDISVEVDGKLVASPQWKPLQENPECGSKAVMIDSKTVKIEWNAKDASDKVVV